MTLDEIYTQIAEHMLEGIMFHEASANYYDFLNLKGFKRMHEYQYLEETCNYRLICRYYLNHHNKLVPHTQPTPSNIIPENWYKYTRQDVDINTKRNAIKTNITEWIKWEKSVKAFYSSMYKELCDIGEIADAIMLKDLIVDVDMEIKNADRLMLDLKSADYAMDVIIPMQEEIHEMYRKLTEDVGKCLC